MLRRRVDDPSAARDRRELGLERREVTADESAETGEAFAEIRGAAIDADVGETVENGGAAIDCERCHRGPRSDADNSFKDS